MSHIVAINAGHGKSIDGSWDPGCTWSGYTEAKLCLAITKQAVKEIRAAGVKVLSDADTGNNRNMIADVRLANAHRPEPEFYMSIHCDYSGAPSGVMPLYVSGSGRKLAKSLEKSIRKTMKMRTRGCQKRTDLFELNDTSMTAVILETGAIRADIKTLRDAKSYGHAVALGVLSYLGVHPPSEQKKEKKEEEVYRVRKAWKDAASQKGAYSVLESAKKCADKNSKKKIIYKVYDEKGKVIYHGNPD